MPEWVLEVLKQQAPSVLAALVVAYFFGKYIIEQHKSHLASKDAEIERLVKEKAELQKLNQRLSTREEPKPDPKKRGKKP